VTKEIKKRSSIFVKKDFQQRFILKVICVLFTLILIPVSLYLIIKLTTSWGNNKFSVMIIYYTYTLLRARFILLAGFLLFLFFILALILSKHIAGPIFKLENELERLVSGDLSRPVKLRENDEFQELAEGINEVTENFKTSLIKTEKIITLIEKNKENIVIDDYTDKQINELKDIINSYKLTSEDQ
jgi:methyl-accepting chemotaxis protein